MNSIEARYHDMPRDQLSTYHASDPSTQMQTSNGFLVDRASLLLVSQALQPLGRGSGHKGVVLCVCVSSCVCDTCSSRRRCVCTAVRCRFPSGERCQHARASKVVEHTDYCIYRLCRAPVLACCTRVLLVSLHQLDGNRSGPQVVVEHVDHALPLEVPGAAGAPECRE